MDLTGQTIVIAHPSSDLYGSDRMMLETLAGLVDTGAEVLVVMPAEGPLTPHVVALGARAVVLQTLVLRKNLLSARGALSIVRQSVNSVWAITTFIRRTRPDIVYVNTVSMPWWPVVARLMRRRVLVHVHEAEGHVRPVIRRLLTLPLVFASEVIANSRYTIRVLAESLPGRAARARLVYNGVAGPSSGSDARDTIADPARLVYFGRISHRKGVDVAIDAVAELERRGRAVRLDVVGAVFEGNEWYAEGLTEKIREQGLQGTIELQGFREDIWGAVEAADIVLIPARLDESFGNTVIEAVLAARPAVVSAMPGLVEAGEHYASVQFVEPDDAGRLATAVEVIVDDWSTWRERALRDRTRAQAHHAPQRYRDQIVAVIAGRTAAS
ncbi:glycosyltransferase [Arthrobacter agilis]|uniref:glycosyltransferase n=1 Tax=Arthrobacter agilis TaxID=37921 RepID=UPI000B35EC75|nr:glycosyltransferase [Arthrobacter agilis]OUM40476.1 hypothetical protein B8W74_13230 [Arthrobacter agilis]PPB45089.1 glycosyl transferase family 1 [Arthrobacter agilis]TPV27793.1 glycosyltransferase [Arthrobacter agilis]VDR31553.1 Mannosylfructose-phosphate synthase [Arthrobacter agilis]